MIFFPHAKINLGLDIVGRREDGYHLLETVMVHTDWEDVLELTPAERTELVVTGRDVCCPPEKNLVMKAYALLSEAVGGLPATRLHLHKNIPDGAGLGGGSADAAWTLRGLNELYALGLPREELARLAATLGADCPFFVYDGPQLCTGIGTDLAPIALPQELAQLTLAIVKPAESVSTAEAYRGVKVARPAESLAQKLSRPVGDWQATVENAFEATVVPLHPAIGAIKAELTAMGAVYASMSGSGSAVYGLFRGEDSDILSERLRAKFADAAVHCSRAEWNPL